MGIFGRKKGKPSRTLYPGTAGRSTEEFSETADREYEYLSGTTGESDAASQNEETYISDTASRNEEMYTGDTAAQNEETHISDTASRNEETYTGDAAAQNEETYISDAAAQNEETYISDAAAQNEETYTGDTAAENEERQPAGGAALNVNARGVSNGSAGKTQLLDSVLDYFIVNEGKLLSRLQHENTDALKETVLKRAKEQFKLQHVKGKLLDEMTDRFSRYMWGYYILDPLIFDRSVFDIKCYSGANIRIKRMGERMAAPEDIRFESDDDYCRFVRMLATKNQVNLSVINALVTFTDNASDADFIMRIDISTGYVNTSGLPCLHIRKIPRMKYGMDELVSLGFMTEEQRRYFEEKVPECGGILFTGSGGSGKTTFMNSLLELYPTDRSGLVIQENEELFSETHPDINFQHVVTASGEGRVNYDLKTLSRQGLLNDIDLFIVGEIKGDEAAAFAMCSYTGAQAWCSCHGKNETEAVYKLADYVKQATGYTLSESLKMLSGLELIVYLKNFHVEGVSEIKGWDYERGTLKIEKKIFKDGAVSKSGNKSDMPARTEEAHDSGMPARTKEAHDSDAVTQNENEWLKMLL